MMKLVMEQALEYAYKANKAKTIEAGMNAHISKPIDAEKNEEYFMRSGE